MNYKAELVAAGKQMLEKKLTVETWGNISLYDAESGLAYMTPSAMPYHTIVEDDVVVVRLSDGEVVEGHRKPTVEKERHLGVYRSRPEIRAVIHTHPVYSQVFAVLHQSIPPIIDEAAQALGGEVLTAEYALPGAVCLGKDLGKAFKTCAVLEMTAQIYQMALAIGKPHVIPDDLVAFMRDFAENHYGQGK